MFAEQYERDADGLIRFPNDVKFRAQHFVGWKEAGLEADHPAKANLYLTEELVKYTTKPGDTIMDITAGSGSILIALIHWRSVIAFDIAPHFTQWMELSRHKILTSREHHIPPRDFLEAHDEHPLSGHILMGDCTAFLPMPADSIIFSPPYAGAMHSGGGILDRDEQIGASIRQYAHDPRNLGLLDDFIYSRKMYEIYQKCFDSLPRGGKLSLIIKDRISQGVRIELGLKAMQALHTAGFQLYEWVKWKPPGSMFTSIHRSHGTKVIEDEHIIIVEKP